MLKAAQQFIDILPEPTLLVASSGEVLAANAAVSRLTGTKAAGVVGSSLSSLVADPPSHLGSYLRLCAKSRQLLPGALTWRVEGGRTLAVRCDGAVVEPKTEATPAVLFLRCRPRIDVTDPFILLNQKIADLSKEILERKKLERQRDELLQAERAARVEAERHGRLKDEFLATLSHELRTPLNAILGWAQLLERERLSEDAAEGVAVIARNARAQKQLIEDLLDMSRIISGRIRLDVQRVDLAQVIEAAVASVRPAAEAKGIRLQLAIDPLAGPVKGDPNRLQQVVWNLLSNAVKFTPKAGRVQVFLERVNSHVEITVADTGVGIKPEFLPLVFERFRQADSSAARHFGGLGLGLSIVKQLVELHGGQVWAKSPGEGQGATFVVLLPLLVVREEVAASVADRVHPAASYVEQGLRDTQELRGVKVLVVDDEPDARQLVRRILENCNATVATAASAGEALALLAAERPDVIVSDIGMPGADGYELLRAVRALPEEKGGRVPAVALTAFARSEDRMRAMLAGYNIHLSKPLEPAELIVTVASLAGRVKAKP